MKRKIISLMCLVALGSVGNAMATVVYDHADAIGYGDAWHSNPAWQQLGGIWDGENGPQDQDSSDDGVSWSIDGGVTYGHDELTAGQTVDFKFDMYKQWSGSHDFDALKVWLDWNQDGNFVFDSNDVVLSTAWGFRSDFGLVKDDGQDILVKSWKSFTASVVIPENVTGTFWMRSRVVCNSDLVYGADYNVDHIANYNWDDSQETLLSSFDAYSYFGEGQGEVEDWALTVVAAPVPEPSTMLLFGAGLSALGFYRRKHKNA